MSEVFPVNCTTGPQQRASNFTSVIHRTALSDRVLSDFGASFFGCSAQNGRIWSNSGD